MLASSCRKASITDSAAFFVSASTTPLPCVPSTSLMISGAPPTRSMTLSVSFTDLANAVTGSPIPWRARICKARSLSRDRPIASAVTSV